MLFLKRCSCVPLIALIATAHIFSTTAHAEQVISKPLSSEEIRDLLTSKNISAVTPTEQHFEIFITDDFEFQFKGISLQEQYQLLKNGLLCSIEPDRRFCYRVHQTSKHIEFRYSDGTIALYGNIKN